MEKFERRRDRFALFDAMDSAAVNICFPLELPDFRAWCKEQGLAPFHVLLCAVLRSVLKVENFRYRILDGEVIRIERLIPSFTVVNQHNDLNFAQFDWSDDLREFVARGVAAREAASSMAELNMEYAARTPLQAKEQVFVTCIPWLAFTSIQHPSASLAQPDIPSFAWGKYRDLPAGRLELPFSVQAHHGFVDGFHIHQLAATIAAELETIISPAVSPPRAG
ncbi:CatA-like O-acetyltransferase [Massilia sp. 9I]|uniref:CatA-like O-acetyltransferase n=1 Tax=Massilia sp. 9I TaxID=2653152 RepID=UPI0012F3CF10|nr:CatA-like O-acetyltransferase [Massilia sp. 9I]VXC40045.1 Chloramphenicol O-acetyltransferase type B/chloramphenicol O-acetyltransferase type A [Massilia sp. 9I]